MDGYMNSGARRPPLEEWILDAWRRVRVIKIFEGGEDGPPVLQRQALAVIDDLGVQTRIQKLATEGVLTGDTCRCPGDLTIALFDEADHLIGAATLHPGRVSWERASYGNDLIAPRIVQLRLLLAEVGINGTSKVLLEPLISALDLFEGDVQFRLAGDAASRSAQIVPAALLPALLRWSGDEAATLESEVVATLTSELVRAEGNVERAIVQLFGWLGAVTWPAEALAGDGLLARRMVERFAVTDVEAVLPTLGEPAAVMGAVVWAANRADDAAVIAALSPAIMKILLL